eukprot:766673-Hanusia_phi.AAC.4
MRASRLDKHDKHSQAHCSLPSAQEHGACAPRPTASPLAGELLLPASSTQPPCPRPAEKWPSRSVRGSCSARTPSSSSRDSSESHR